MGAAIRAALRRHVDGLAATLRQMAAGRPAPPADGLGRAAGGVRSGRRAATALRARHALLTAVMEGTTDALWVKDPAGVYLIINGPGARMLGRTIDEVVGRAEGALFTAASAADVRARDLAVLVAGETRTEETLATSADGVTRAYLTTRSPLRDAAGRAVGVVGVSRDVTERREAERALARSHAQLAATLEATADAILVLDADGRVTGYNRKLLDLWDLPADLAAAGDGAAVLARVSTRLADPEAFLAAVHHVPLTADVVTDDVLHFADGRVVERHSQPQRVAAPGAGAEAEAEAGAPAAGGTIVGRVFSFRDVTARTQLEGQLAYQAFHDPLTGLANRALFQDRVAHALARRSRPDAGPDAGAGEHLAVLLLDLDDFKHVNDSLGHAAGDRLLGEVATRLRHATRGVDTVARLGGDEFAVLLEGMATPGDADTVVARLARALAEPITIASGLGAAAVTEGDGPPAGVAYTRVTVRASLGIAHATPDDGPEELVRNADVAMYRAKAAGKGGHAVYVPAMHAAALARLTREAALRAAAADPAAHGMTLVYQPVVDLATGRITKVEALLRWHPLGEAAPVGPADFIPLAEETGCIVPIGRWVLDTACRQLAAWHATLPPEAVPGLAVNLSGRQLDDPDVVAAVAASLARAGVAPERVTLEVTETALARDPDAACDTLVALKRLGVRLAVDDFGTGYSNLGHLQRFPLDLLKIDKRFVDGVARGGADAALARTVVALGQSLGLRTVAEGVEDAAQHAALVALGCPLGQGYLFARPLAPEAMTARLAAGAAAAPPAGGRAP